VRSRPPHTTFSLRVRSRAAGHGASSRASQLPPLLLLSRQLAKLPRRRRTQARQGPRAGSAGEQPLPIKAPEKTTPVEEKPQPPIEVPRRLDPGVAFFPWKLIPLELTPPRQERQATRDASASPGTPTGLPVTPGKAIGLDESRLSAKKRRLIKSLFGDSPVKT
jgi:hypothetical protein